MGVPVDHTPGKKAQGQHSASPLTTDTLSPILTLPPNKGHQHRVLAAQL